MQAVSYQYTASNWQHELSSQIASEINPQLLLCFGSKQVLSSPGIYNAFHEKFPNASVVMCSTAGEISDTTVQDDSLVVTALEFDYTNVKTAVMNMCDFSNSYDAAGALLNDLPKEELQYVLVLSDGSMVNGSELVKGVNYFTGGNIPVTGGFAGDADHFVSTLVGLNADPLPGNIVAVGFYGRRLKVCHGSQAGWEIFGPQRTITRSEGNVLYEVDHKNVLDLYKRYLGPDANQLPSSALLFPLSLQMPGDDRQVVRTILSIDETQNSMTFAGDVPENAKARFMRANFDKLISAAENAVQHSAQLQAAPVFSLLISCMGRKLVLGKRIEEEVEAVKEKLGNQTIISGFYSYGEIAPFNEGGDCHLHNQTITITSFYEL